MSETEPDPRDATIERLQRDRLEWRNRAILAESEIRRAEPSAPLPETVALGDYEAACRNLAAATERATRAGSMIAASILAALDSDEGDADYRLCAGCDSIADSCRQAGCPAATPTSEAKP